MKNTGIKISLADILANEGIIRKDESQPLFPVSSFTKEELRIIREENFINKYLSGEE